MLDILIIRDVKTVVYQNW